MPPNLILTNGHIYTMDPRLPQVTAVAIRDGHIFAVGDDIAIKELASTGSEWLDLNGRSVVPGLVDAHVHFEGFALSRRRVDLDDASSLDEVLQRISGYADQLRDEEQQFGHNGWLQGRGWAQDTWVDAAFPTAAQLDKIVLDMAVYLRHKSGHAAWANSRALKIAGITAVTDDPPGGQIQRDLSGQPTGILFEDAMDLVKRHVPKPSIAEISRAMLDAQQYCWQVGLTGVHDFDGRSCFQAFQQIHQQGQLGLRVVKNIPLARIDQATGVGLQSGFGDEWLRIGGIKIFADGALGPRTAAMIEPYESQPQNYGITVVDKEEMKAAASMASEHGLSVTVHAIGDRANHDILDVYEAVRREEQARGEPRQLRHRIEHVQLLHPTDLHRLAQLNVIASMQPIHATSDMHMAAAYWGDRTQYSYAWRTMLNSGATLVFGSDAPVERIDPLPGIHAAVTRRTLDGAPGPDGWHSEQRLTLHETIHAFTRAAAVTSGQENRLGSISRGKLADLTIFEQDIFACPPDDLRHVDIAATIVNGEFKHRFF
jgi:predicted amidohydrolase YtcJ